MVKSGYLKKRGDIIPRWKLRYFELSSLEFSYYEYEGGPKKGEIILTKTTKIRKYLITMLDYTFQIKDKRTGIEIYLCAETENIQNGWIEALIQSVNRIKLPILDITPRKINNNNNLILSPSPSSSSLLSITSSSISTSISNTPSSSSTMIIKRNNQNIIYGYCRCGAIELEIENNSIIHGYCHCLFCQKYSSSPFVSVLLYPTKCIQITKGKIIIGKFNMTKHVNRYFCRQCLCYLMHEYVNFPSGSCTAILYGTLSPISDDIFKPQLHINYESKKISIMDGLPKYQGIPTIWGGLNDTIISEE